MGKPTLILILVSVIGCDSGRNVGADPPVQPRSIVLNETVRIDGNAAALVPLPNSGAVAPYEDGSVAVAQPLAGAIEYFDGNGLSSGTFGQKGKGPGEFVGNIRIGKFQAGLWAFDGSARRLTLVSSEHDLIQTVSFAAGASPSPEDAGIIPGSKYFIPLGVPSPSSVVGLVLPMGDNEVPEMYRDRTLFVDADMSGKTRSVLTTLAENEKLVTERGSIGVPFVTNDLIAVAPGGELFATVRRTREGSEDSITVTRMNVRGDTAYSAAFSVSPAEVPQSVKDSIYGRMIERTERDPELQDKVRERQRSPAFYPAAVVVIVGDDGATWIQQGAAPLDSIRILGIARDGASAVTARLPPRSRLLAGSNDAIWVAVRDEYDVESLVRYEVN